MRQIVHTVALAALLACVPTVSAATAPMDVQAAVTRIRHAAVEQHSGRVLVVREGKVLLDYTDPAIGKTGYDMMSATKSVVSLAIGLLVTDGKIKALDEPVSDFYPEWKQGQKAKITLRMLMNHTSGLQNVPNTGVEIYPAPDMIQLALAAELSDPPGTRFSYNNKAMNLLSGIVGKVAGMPMDVFLKERLFTPMGMSSEWAEYDKAGHPQAMTGWVATAEDAVKIGQLVLDHGRWQGKQLVRADFVDQMLAQATPLSEEYGLLWWRVAAYDRFDVYPDVVARLQARGVPGSLASKLAPVAGKHFETRRAYQQAVAAAMGGVDSDLRKSMVSLGIAVNDLARRDRGPTKAFEAEGYLGNYVTVVPAVGLVAVRQVGENAHAPQPWPWDYSAFAEDVLALGDALEGGQAKAGKSP